MPLESEMVKWQMWSEKEWENWLRGRLEERKQVFGSDPDELISSYNREKSHASSYEGRELLELIQNADDSGAGYPTPNKLLIKLTQDALYVYKVTAIFASQNSRKSPPILIAVFS